MSLESIKLASATQNLGLPLFNLAELGHYYKNKF